MKITLDDIEQFSVPLEDYVSNWIFMDENDKLAPAEHQDQIFALTKEAANFLWDFDMQLGIDCSEKYFKVITIFESGTAKTAEIKKFLYNLGIPFSHKVFIAMQPDTGFVLTWKMVIKYSHNLFFGYDQVVRDRTLNWALQFDHDDIFTFGKDIIFDAAKEKQKNIEKIDNALKEMAERKKQQENYLKQ
ncbi:MAG: hypothetical protein J6O88_10565 [Chryseobacterium sp.]|uniref:hypothetical protein n=1 Tax=Chryseobacterium sp. TaxID=1871047 RepID=UPI001B165E85|nr:hypothetical protein [Chryseobacterium sp.]MBO6185107.1 hypothetical protein [Chryseobacterium sp.]